MNRKFTKKNKTILLTFDYELFFGNSGTPEKCILEPVNRLQEIFDKYDISATFFIDVLYYLRLLENKVTKETGKIIKHQLQELVSHGHRIELHLHPLWLDAYYQNGQWVFTDYKHYRLQSLPEEKVIDLFVSGAEVLEDAAREVDPTYKVIAFRAGGLCNQPFDKLAKGFIKTGIEIDSSVVYGFRGTSDSHAYDFTGAPDLEFYKFTQDPTVIEGNGLFYQLPVTSYKRNFCEKTARKIKMRFHPEDFRIYGDGTAQGVPVKLWKKFLPTRETFSLELVVPDVLVKRIEDSGKWLVNFLSHPKFLSPVSFTAIERLYTEGYKFLNTMQILDEMKKMG